jgi:hypothetical protein
MDNKVVYAVVLNYNSSADVEKCLSFLIKQTYENMNIVVVDNASSIISESTQLKNICAHYKVDLICNSENKGFSAGNNVGLKFAIKNDAEWCMIINPDVELRDTTYVERVMSKVEQFPEAVVIGTDIHMPDGTRQNPMRECTFAEEVFWTIDALKHKLGIWKGYLGKDISGYCEKLAGCCFFIRSSFVRKIGYLDENVFMYCEEPILASQVKSNGYRELYLKEIVAYHQHFPAQKGSSAKRMVKMAESRIYYLKKYSGYKGIQLKLAVWSKKIQGKLWKMKITSETNTR